MSDDRFIAITSVSKRFGGFTAVEGVSLDIRRGELFALLGPSGCGKTTLLRMIAGFESPSEGAISIDGAAMTHVPPNLRPTNMVFQSYAVFPHLTVRQNVGYGLRRERLARAEHDRRVNEALALVHLTGLDARKPSQLSGGQRQRVALARALIKRPKVLLLDEPLSALDKKLRDEMQVELRLLQRSVGITFVIVTHDQEEALALADRLGVMFDGRLEQVDTPRGLYERPATARLAGFIGHMNFLSGRVLGREGGRAVIEAEALGRFELPTERAPASGAVRIAFRPERVAVRRPGDEPAQGLAVAARPLSASFLGDRSILLAEVSGAERPLTITVGDADPRALLSGGELSLLVPSEHILVFPA